MFGFFADPDRDTDQAFHLDADPNRDLDPGSQTNADPDPGQTFKSQKAEFLHDKYTLSRL
jgi:hypothetical protein